MMYIYKFKPYLKPVIWGGDKIPLKKGITAGSDPIGESWEISGIDGFESVVANGPEAGLSLSELIHRYKGALVGNKVYARYGNDFPLLVKFIDARSNLSIQVHPDDELAMQRHGCSGKTEMWYIIESENDADIIAGLSQSITPEKYIDMVADNSIMDAVSHHTSAPGDVFFIPPGCIHSIGAGNFLAEIQQASDITYRVYDYDRRDASGNPRHLHTLEARDAINYNIDTPHHIKYDHDAARATLVHCDYFTVHRHSLNGEIKIDTPTDSFFIVVNMHGTLTITADGMPPCTLEAYETALIPADAGNVRIAGNTVFLTATV